jgi:hypothetical protein
MRESLSLLGEIVLALGALGALACGHYESPWTFTHTEGQEVAFGHEGFCTLTLPAVLDTLCRHRTFATCCHEGDKLVLVVAANEHLSIDCVVVAGVLRNLALGLLTAKVTAF